MPATNQKEKAIQFKRFHEGPPILVLPNAWDAASARIFEQAGARAIATTSSGVAAALGYPDGELISREMMIEVVARITRVVDCPVTVDSEAGYGATVDEVRQTIRAVIEVGAVGINIEDSRRGAGRALVDVPRQVELIKALRELARSMDIPFVINARTDAFLLKVENAFEQAVQRLNTYRQAGADCLFAIGVRDAETIGKLVQAINGPLNVVGGPAAPPIAELARLGVARVSLASGLMRATLAHLRRVSHELLEQGTYTSMAGEMLTSAELQGLFVGR
jgi:2-methylisocitrate lyase-like PEP mutase family enzyme